MVIHAECKMEIQSLLKTIKPKISEHQSTEDRSHLSISLIRFVWKAWNPQNLQETFWETVFFLPTQSILLDQMLLHSAVETGILTLSYIRLWTGRRSNCKFVLDWDLCTLSICELWARNKCWYLTFFKCVWACKLDAKHWYEKDTALVAAQIWAVRKDQSGSATKIHCTL